MNKINTPQFKNIYNDRQQEQYMRNRADRLPGLKEDAAKHHDHPAHCQ